MSSAELVCGRQSNSVCFTLFFFPISRPKSSPFSLCDVFFKKNESSLCSSNSRRIINLSPVMVIPEEQPAQPALPIQPEGMRVVCGHCGNTFLVCNPTQMTNLNNRRVACAEFFLLWCCWCVHICNLESQTTACFSIFGDESVGLTTAL